MNMIKMQNKNFFVSMLFILALSIAACEQAIQDGIIKEMNSFGDCAKAGYPIMESYPRQCKTPDGTTYIEQVDKEIQKTIETEKGELKLNYKENKTNLERSTPYKYNKALLTGTLERSTPCVNWTVRIGGTKDMQRSQVTINIFNSNKEAICIQVLGEPQEIYEKIFDVSEETEYTVKIEQEVVFEGKLNG